jgi:hypothetical protein
MHLLENKTKKMLTGTALTIYRREEKRNIYIHIYIYTYSFGQRSRRKETTWVE